MEKKGQRPRTVIFTHGAKPVIVARCLPGSDEVELKEYPVTLIPKEQLVDTNGAGDSFVGAFLANLYLGNNFEEAMKAAIYLSGEVVKRSGCVFPDKVEM